MDFELVADLEGEVMLTAYRVGEGGEAGVLV